MIKKLFLAAAAALVLLAAWTVRDSSVAAETAPLTEASVQLPPGFVQAFQVYVIRAEKAAIWKEYANHLAVVYEEVAILNQFGLASAELVQQLAEKKQTAGESYRMAAAERNAAYESIQNTYSTTSTTSTEDQPATVAEASELQAVQDAVEAAMQSMDEALDLVRQAEEAMETAELQQQSGLLSMEQVLAAKERYWQVKIAALPLIDAYITAVIQAHETRKGTSMPISELLKLMEEQHPALLEMWMDAGARYADAIPTASADLSDNKELPADPPESGRIPPVLSPTVFALMPSTLKLTPLPMEIGNGEVYVPLRQFAEALQYKVDWTQTEKTIVLTRNGKSIQLRLQDTTILRNKTALPLTAAPILHSGSTHVPLSFFRRAWNFDVYWNADYKQGYIIGIDGQGSESP